MANQGPRVQLLGAVGLDHLSRGNRREPDTGGAHGAVWHRVLRQLPGCRESVRSLGGDRHCGLRAFAQRGDLSRVLTIPKSHHRALHGEAAAGAFGHAGYV